jgi:DNA-binding transcriptional regulator GbsR (MarR family)
MGYFYLYMVQKQKAYQEALEQFLLLWGEMAPAWGINKTMAQIHALLYAEEAPLDTDTIMSQLGISRGNANMNLRKLIEWGLVSKHQHEGSRKEYFSAEKDVWVIASIIIQERQYRELVPVKQNLIECLELLQKNEKSDENASEIAVFRERIEDFIKVLDLFEEFSAALLPYVESKKLGSLKTLLKLAKAPNMVMKRITGRSSSAEKKSAKGDK